jgi:hypothetical protein
MWIRVATELGAIPPTPDSFDFREYCQVRILGGDAARKTSDQGSQNNCRTPWSRHCAT